MGNNRRRRSDSQRSNNRNNNSNNNPDYYDDENYDNSYEDNIFQDSDLEQVDIYYDNYPKDLSEYNIDDEIEEDDEEDSGKAKFFHIAFLITTVVIIAIVAILIINWQKGIVLDITEENLAAFESESEDFYVDFDPYVNPGYVDDGEYNVVILGDDTIANCTDETSIPNLIAKKSGANVTTFALPGATCAIANTEYNSEDPSDFYSFYYVANRIASLDFDPLKQAWDDMEDSSMYYDYWNAIHNYDFSKADIIVICYGTNDFLENMPMIQENPYAYREYGTSLGTAGALDISLGVLKDAYPCAQIIVSSPSFFFKDDGNGGKVGADLSGYGNEYGNLGGYVVYMLNASLYHSVTFLDNYFGLEFNSSNNEGYLDEDGCYPNAKGREVLADHIVENFYYLKEKSVIAQ